MTAPLEASGGFVIHLELTIADAQFLHKHLLRRLKWLVHIEKHDLQQALAAEAQHLRESIDRLMPA